MAASTHDQDVFSFYPDGSFCNGFEDVLSRYREIVPHLRLAGYRLHKFLFLENIIILIPFIDNIVLVLIIFRSYFICAGN
jgi:hypothetical protein